MAIRMEHQETKHETKQATKKTAIDPIVLASGASVLLAWYFFYVKEEREQGLFVGLWPPTLMAFASYFRGARMEDMLQHRGMSASGVVSKIQELVQEQS